MQKLLYHPFFILTVTVFSLFFCFSLYQNVLEIRKSTENVTVLDQENAKLASEISDLEAQYQQASSSFAVEKITRDQLLMQKPGELVVQLPPLPSPSAQPNQNNSSATPWQAWWQVLFN